MSSKIARMKAKAAQPARPRPASTASTAPSGVLCFNCMKDAVSTNSCSICQGMKIKAMFCTPECYRDSYKKHKKLHKKVDIGTYTYPEGTRDAFAMKDATFKYTGTLRAVTALKREDDVPKRHVPESIAKPDYASHPRGFSDEESADRKNAQGKVLTAEGIEKMRVVCRFGREILDIAAKKIAPGVTTLELDAIVHEETIKRGAYPSPLGYGKFPRSVCTSVNEVICHGIPDFRPLEDGDIVNLDVSVYYDGYHSDLNATYPVGNVSEENLHLMKTARKCLDEAIRLVKPGAQCKDFGNTIERVAKEGGLSVNRTYVGHGVNNLFHTSPNISHFGNNRDIGVLKPGMTFTIEPMICSGLPDDDKWPDDWTAVSVDGKYSAQYEETLLVTEDGVEVLTAAPGWTLPEAEPQETK